MATTTTLRGGALMWPTTCFWGACGVFTLDMAYNRFERWFSGWVYVSVLMNIANTPWSVCVLDGWCDDHLSTMYRRLYTRLVASTCLVSRAIIVYKACRHLTGFGDRELEYERSWPISGPRRRQYRIYASSVVIGYILLVLPVNLARLYLMHRSEEFDDAKLLLFYFFNMYTQNWSMCCMETHFAILCFGVYLKFRAINDELSAVRSDVMVSNRYPMALRSSSTAAAAAAASVLQDPRGRPMEAAVEELGVRHRLTRESVEQLNNMFGGQLALSLIALCVMMLFDIYNEAFRMVSTNFRSKFIFGWILQYLFRFFVIVITAHSTTQEGYKTKVLVTEINNRHLNNSTKYELQLFLKQMNHQSIDITACDCFTLNGHLIASAIAVGTTYLFVLIQFHSEIMQFTEHQKS
ncbi:Gustatory receptor [Aphis craccivora]|uniref:Gustatory receptor n=1 Tax=Aphis craccivora TaxID=307492 RepID=A0A6G0ZQG7_APHCR|nr:Gustatory receptor [Aphis craccivora]